MIVTFIYLCRFELIYSLHTLLKNKRKLFETENTCLRVWPHKGEGYDPQGSSGGEAGGHRRRYAELIKREKRYCTG